MLCFTLCLCGLLINAFCQSHSSNRKPLNRSTDYLSLKEEMASFINKKIKKHNIAGLSIALVDNQDIAWIKGFGYSDKSKGDKIFPNTLFRVGSISKLFTATAIMQLEEQGKIDLDKPVMDYLPEFNIKTRFVHSDPITIRHLLTHHSGIPGDYHKPAEKDSGKNQPGILTEINSIHMSFPPGHVFLYSNLGASVLGKIIERVTGQEFNTYIKSTLLAPLNMMNSTFDENEVPDSLLAKGHHDGNYFASKKWERIESAGSLYSSTEEMANFIKLINNQGEFNNQIVLNEATISNMLSAQNKNVVLDQNFRIGLAWFLSYPSLAYAGKVAGHSGGTYLYNSALIILPAHKLGVAVFANSSNSLEICQDIAKEALKYALKIKKGIIPPEKQKEKNDVVTLPRDLMNKLIGFYSLGKGGLATVYAKRNKLFAMVKGKKVRLVYNSNGTFTFQRAILGIIPMALKNLRVSLLEFKENTYVVSHQKNGLKNVAGFKLKQRDIPDAWKKRIGQYIILNQSSRFSIEIQDGFLIFGSYVIIPTDDDKAVFTGFDRGLGGETIVASIKDGKEILKHHGIVMRRVE